VIVFAVAALLADPVTPPPVAPPAAAAQAPALLGRWVTSEDYPAAALRAGEQGRVGFRVTVGPDGRPADCAITQSSRSAILDSTTCRLIVRRGRFSPARDSAGRPAAGTWEGSYRWEILPPAPSPALAAIAARPNDPGSWVANADYPVAALRNHEQGVTGFTLTVGADGLPTACAVTMSSGSASLDEATCKLMMERSRFTPAKDEAGESVVGTWASRFRWELPAPPPPSQSK
jgi:TonB family protein